MGQASVPWVCECKFSGTFPHLSLSPRVVLICWKPFTCLGRQEWVGNKALRSGFGKFTLLGFGLGFWSTRPQGIHRWAQNSPLRACCTCPEERHLLQPPPNSGSCTLYSDTRIKWHSLFCFTFWTPLVTLSLFCSLPCSLVSLCVRIWYSWYILSTWKVYKFNYGTQQGGRILTL